MESGQNLGGEALGDGMEIAEAIFGIEISEDIGEYMDDIGFGRCFFDFIDGFAMSGFVAMSNFVAMMGRI